MSVLAVEHKSLSPDWHLPAFLKRLFAARVAQGRLHANLKDLPDYLLLDIGVDPRQVPMGLDEAIARPDLAHGGVVTTGFRTAAPPHTA